MKFLVKKNEWNCQQRNTNFSTREYPLHTKSNTISISERSLQQTIATYNIKGPFPARLHQNQALTVIFEEPFPS